MNTTTQLPPIHSANSLADLSRLIELHVNHLNKEKSQTTRWIGLAKLIQVLWKNKGIYTLCDDSAEADLLFYELKQQFECASLISYNTSECDVIIANSKTFLMGLSQRLRDCSRSTWKF